MVYKENLDSFAVLLRGKSIEKISTAKGQFEDCMFVNNFDAEVKRFGNDLKCERSMQLVNQQTTVIWKEENYKEMGVKDVIFYKPKKAENEKMKDAKAVYKKYGLNIHYMPENILKYAKLFGKKDKFPNTGMLAIFYAVKELKPKDLWIVGLDFYQTDYIERKFHQSPLEKQQQKMADFNIPSIFEEHILKAHPEINFHLVTYYDDYPDLKNVEIR